MTLLEADLDLSLVDVFLFLVIHFVHILLNVLLELLASTSRQLISTLNFF